MQKSMKKDYDWEFETNSYSSVERETLSEEYFEKNYDMPNKENMWEDIDS